MFGLHHVFVNKGSAPIGEASAVDHEKFPFADTEDLQVQPAAKDVQPVLEPLDALHTRVEEAPVGVEPKGFYNLVAKDIEGEFMELSQFAGSVAVVVNVASQ